MRKKRESRFFKKALRSAEAWFALGAFLLAWATTGTGCWIRSTIGLPCPGCGMTRALWAALRGDWNTACRMHPLWWLMPFILAAVIFMQISKKQTMSSLLNLVFASLAVLFVVVYLIRMVLYFPNQEPMTWNKQAFLIRIGRRLLSLFFGSHQFEG